MFLAGMSNASRPVSPDGYMHGEWLLFGLIALAAIITLVCSFE